MYLQPVCFGIRYIKGKLEFALHYEKMTILPYSPIVFGVSIKSDYAEWRQHRSKKNFSDVTNLYDVTIRRFLYISYTFSWKTGFLFVRESLTRIYEKKIKGLLSLVGYLVYLWQSWQNEENDKGPSMGSRIKRFEYRKFLWAENEIAHNFAKSRKAMEDLANMMVFLLVRNFISIHAKTWSVFVSKEIVQWPSGTRLPGFDHMLKLLVWIRYFVTEVHWVKFRHRIHLSF